MSLNGLFSKKLTAQVTTRRAWIVRVGHTFRSLARAITPTGQKKKLYVDCVLSMLTRVARGGIHVVHDVRQRGGAAKYFELPKRVMLLALNFEVLQL